LEGNDISVASRKLRARRTNERVKLVSTSLNTVALAILGAAFIVPGGVSLEAVRWMWIPVAFILHLGAHLVLRFLKSED
jgi:lipopolysaccharide export LptBFGC system permease protein LptF